VLHVSALQFFSILSSVFLMKFHTMIIEIIMIIFKFEYCLEGLCNRPTIIKNCSFNKLLRRFAIFSIIIINTLYNLDIDCTDIYSSENLTIILEFKIQDLHASLNTARTNYRMFFTGFIRSSGVCVRSGTVHVCPYCVRLHASFRHVTYFCFTSFILLLFFYSCVYFSQTVLLITHSTLPLFSSHSLSLSLSLSHPSLPLPLPSLSPLSLFLSASPSPLQELRCEVAIKIIKSRKPFMLQAQTEIELLMLMLEKDRWVACCVLCVFICVWVWDCVLFMCVSAIVCCCVWSHHYQCVGCCVWVSERERLCVMIICVRL
jgi:hypothetical protein